MSERREGHNATRRQTMKRWKVALVAVLTIAMVMQSSNVQAIAEGIAEGLAGDRPVVTDTMPTDGTGTDAATGTEDVTTDETAEDTTSTEATVPETDETATDAEPTEEESTDAPAAPEEVVEDTTETEAPAETPAEEAETTVTLNVEISGAKLTYTAEDGTEQNVTPETDPKSVDVPNTLDFKFTVTPDEGQRVSSVSYGETELTADEAGTYTVATADLTDGEKIVVTTEAVPAAETPAEETPAEPEAPAEEAPVEDEATPSEYSLTISHRLEVTGGYYESVETVRVSPDSLINGEYDPAQNAKSVDGLRVVSSSPVKVVDFEDDGVAETTLEYGVADSYQVDPLDEGNENSYVLLGELEDINIQAASQKFVVVRFQYESGATAAEPYSQAISANDEGKFAFEYSVNVPDGFTMRVETDGVYVEGNTISMTYTDNSDAEVVVVFVGTEAEFKVEYYFQKLEGSEYDHDSSRDETRTGLVTTLTDVQPSQIDGFTYQPVEQQIIEASGTVVKVFYNRNTYTLMYDTNGGSYVPSTSVRYGQAVSLVSGDDAPTRKGYTFDGWYLDEDLSKKADSSVVLSGDTTVYAKWDGAIVGYKVVYMTENADDNGYSYAGTVELSAKAGTTVSADNMTQKPYGFDTQHFSFERATSADVAADGSTVITVRYSRNEYTITFEGTGGRQLVCGKDAHEHSRYEGCYELDCPYGGTSIIHWWHDDYSHTICGLEEHSHTSECYGYRDTLTITAKYQAFIGDQWLDLVKGTSWYWSGKQFTSYQASMPGENKSLEKYSDGCNRNLLYYIEDPEGTVEYRGKTFTLFADVLSTGDYPTFDEEFFAIDGYDRYGSTIEKWQNGTEGYGNASWDKTGGGSFYYTRHSYDLELIGGGVSESHEVPYLGSFSDEAGSFINEMGSSFDGWYLDPEFTTPYEGDFTMPKGLVLYAKTKVNTYDVTFLCEENGDQFGTAMTVEENDTVENPGIPTKEGYVFDGWYWRVDGAEQAYDFANQITGDTIIYAKWRESSTVAYTVQHKIGNEVIKETEPVTVSVGTTVQANALSNDELVKISSQYDGYLPDAYTKSIKVSAEEHTIVFNYASPSSLTYKVAYVTEAGTQVYVENEGNPVSASASEFIVTPTEEGQRWAELNGYSFIDESVVAKLSVGSENVIKITVEPTEYTITYDLGEGAWDPESDGNHPETYTVAEIESPGVSITAQPVRDGYAFAGWELGELTSVKDPAGGEFGSPKTFSLAGGTVGHLKFKAKWEKLNKVTYDWGEPAFEGVREGEVPTLPTDNGSYVPGQNYTVDKTYAAGASVNSYDAYGNVNGTWTFSGWTDPNNGVMGNSDVPITGEWTYAEAEVDTYTVTYRYDGAVPEGAPALPSTQEYVLNQPVKVATDPAFANWTFSGWDTEDFTMPDHDVVISGSWSTGTSALSVSNYSGVYDGESHGITVNGLIEGDVVSYSVSNSFTDVTGSPVSVKATVTRNGVAIWTGTASVSITPATIRVTISDATKVEGQVDPGLESTYVVPVAGELAGFEGSIAREPGEEPGTYVIGRGTLVLVDRTAQLAGEKDFKASNYTLEVVPGTFTITAAPGGGDNPGGGTDTPDNPGGGGGTDNPGGGTGTNPGGGTGGTNPGGAGTGTGTGAGTGTGTGAGTNPAPTPVTAAADDDAAADDEAINDDENPLADDASADDESDDAESIDDDSNPLASGTGSTAETCWVHWAVIVGIIVTVAYFAVCAARTRRATDELTSFEDDVLDRR
ncbi:InlB B-repeat-containing protein [Olsenella sp. An188]|uniref:InlB B-repeat-containing protein n=1 Tax=Olsenella sp. An188 TaxID=1965579 RepID=UPI00117D3CA0|nr:InlB B-repeat-containing protein [Olsenella sp. An188]